MAEWITASRLRGVLRFHYKTIGRLALWVLLIIVAVHILSLLSPLLFGNTYPFEGIRADFEVVFMASLIISIFTAGRSSRFLLRIGTSRTSVWLGNVAGLLSGMVALLTATFLLNMLVAALLFPLTSWRPDGYIMYGEMYKKELAAGLAYLPTQILYTLEWTSIFYLYACLLRRFRVATISVTIAVPLFFVILMLFPAVREALSVVRGEDQGQMMLLGLQWLQILQDIVRFIENNWDALQLTAGIVSLPLSYLVMRGTKQP